MLHMYKEFAEWCEQFHSFYCVIPPKDTLKVMYFCMPWKIKVLFFLHRMQCFYEHKILAAMPIGWRIKRLEKWLNKQSVWVRQFNTSFKITKLQRLKWKWSGWRFKIFHRKRYNRCIKEIGERIANKLELYLLGYTQESNF